jgi:hypothetical protein
MDLRNRIARLEEIEARRNFVLRRAELAAKVEVYRARVREWCRRCGRPERQFDRLDDEDFCRLLTAAIHRARGKP